MSLQIRHATDSDLKAIVKIRNHYILNSNALFESTMETVESRFSWFAKFSSTGVQQIFVAEDKGEIIGYASSSKYRDGEYFAKTAEVSVYVKNGVAGKGVGTALYKKLFEVVATSGLHTLVAGIALPNEASINLHRKFGFGEVGAFKEYAVKNGKFISSMWMQKIL
jgi:phosphinothricin acetyltransferase